MKTVHGNAAFTAALANYTRLRAEKNELEAQRSRIVGRRNVELTQAREDRLRRQADTLLAGGAFEETKSSAVLDKEAAEISRALPAYDAAIHLAGDALDRARRAAVLETQGFMRAEFQASFKELAQTAIAHGHAVVKVFDLIDSLAAATDGEPQLYLMPVTPYAAMGDPRRESSRLMRLLAASVELGAIDASDVPAEWISQWETWQFFRSRGGSPITDCADPHWSDAPRPVKKSQPIEPPKKRDNASPPGTVRVRFLKNGAGAGGAFSVHDVGDIPEHQVQDFIDAGAAELFKGKALNVRHLDLTTPRADSEDTAWTTVAA